MILLIDNYDSFTYNLYQVLSILGAEVEVVRNDAIAEEDVSALRPAGIVISPGPGDPSSAGLSCRVLREISPTTPTLGVCLGHQCMGAAYGARVVGAATLMHGKTSRVLHGGGGIFRGLPAPFEAVRYHSLTVDPSSVSPPLEVTAWAEDGTVMGLRHRDYPIEGVQFHPESVLTYEGPKLLRNFLEDCGIETREAPQALSGKGVAAPNPGHR
jgi:anthranilate synthase/aminodeoxychorismate synthase-like glutamine amidotransferase